MISPLTNHTTFIPSPGLAGPNPSQPMESNTQNDLQNMHQAALAHAEPDNTAMSEKTDIKSTSPVVTEKSKGSNILDDISDTKMSDLSQNRSCNQNSMISCDASLACENLSHPISIVPQSNIASNVFEQNMMSNSSVDMSSPVKINDAFMRPSSLQEGSNLSLNESKFTRESSISMDIDETMNSERCSLKESDSGTETMEVDFLILNFIVFHSIFILNIII